MGKPKLNKARVMAKALEASGLKFVLVIGTESGLTTFTNLPDGGVHETMIFLKNTIARLAEETDRTKN